ncbi:MAG TPA: hypothetical protein VGL57_00210 [Solirubrobacteraceae bacterium]
MPSPLPPVPNKLPSPKARVILAAGVLAVGIALGALIGPGPASSLASGQRSATIARVLALLALDHAGASRSPTEASAVHLPPSTTRQTPTSTPADTPAITSNTSSKASGTQSETTSSSSPGHSPTTNELSQTKGKSPAAGSQESQPTRLPPVAHVWLIVLPYGESFSNVLGQPSAAPYLTGQLVGQGTLLSAYSSLATSELAGTATLLSGQEASAVSTLVAPCAEATSVPGATTTAASATPCAATEPAGAQAADTFLREVVPQITATAGYREGGLIAITFAAAGEASGNAPAGPPAAGAPATPAISYPAGTQASALTAAGTPGALLLSPFLRRPGSHTQSVYDQLAPRKSLEELLTYPSTTDHR